MYRGKFEYQVCYLFYNSAYYPAVQNIDILSSGTLQDLIPRISEGELEVSRHRISEFLSTHTAYELLPDSGKV